LPHSCPRADVTTLHDPTPHPGNRVDAVAAVLGRFTLARAPLSISTIECFCGYCSALLEQADFRDPPPSFVAVFKRAQEGVARTRSVLFFGESNITRALSILRAAALLPPMSVSR